MTLTFRPLSNDPPQNAHPVALARAHSQLVVDFLADYALMPDSGRLVKARACAAEALQMIDDALGVTPLPKKDAHQ